MCVSRCVSVNLDACVETRGAISEVAPQLLSTISFLRQGLSLTSHQVGEVAWQWAIGTYLSPPSQHVAPCLASVFFIWVLELKYKWVHLHSKYFVIEAISPAPWLAVQEYSVLIWNRFGILGIEPRALNIPDKDCPIWTMSPLLTTVCLSRHWYYNRLSTFGAYWGCLVFLRW